MGLLDRVKGTAGDVVASAQDQMSKSQAKHQADEMFKVLGQAYFAHHCGRATLDEVEALAVGMRRRMRPIEEQLGPVPFPQPLPEPAPPALPPAGGTGEGTAGRTAGGVAEGTEPTRVDESRRADATRVTDTGATVDWTDVEDRTEVEGWAPQAWAPPPPPRPPRQPGDAPRP